MHCIQKHPLWHLLVLLWISNKEFEDTKGVIRILKSKDRQHNGLELEDTKGVIRILKS